ncbi:hypothetical protein AAFF_G00100570 [Aldrovandia affinis]|uniref:Myb/SANT-like DNA-binding domain-containing protein n=1 Tax=Aldrovandia affinis TaxID=143900 RepID=A0AAD7RUP8_9TELE|nr:hypothetical protein AAFF_G00100570 [Aldrovandia affinis]
MDESFARLRQERFSKGESDLLVREVQSRQERIYGTPKKPPRASDVKAAWEEVAAIITASSSGGPLRTAVQCRKRFNDVKRRGRKLASCRRDTRSTGGGPPTTQSLTPAEETAGSTLPTESAQGFGGLQADAPGPLAEGRPQTQPEPETGGPARQEEGDDNPGLPNRRPSGGQRRTQGQRDQPFLELQRAGFDMLQRELGLLRRTINSRLRRMESRAHPLRVSISRSLERLANVAERQSGPARAPSTPRAPRHPPAEPSPSSGGDQVARDPSRPPRRAAAATCNRAQRTGGRGEVGARIRGGKRGTH